MVHDYLPALLGFFAGLSFGLAVALGLCIWWLRAIHKSIYETPEGLDPMPPSPEDSTEDHSVTEEEPDEWWKRS